MRRALYYPHTEIQEKTTEGENLLKRALLLWDKLEYIVPDDQYQPYYENPLFKEAMEVVGCRHVPNDQERRLVHEQVEELVTRPIIPEVFYYHGQQDPYEIYPQKLLNETWKLLQSSNIAGKTLPTNGDYPLTQQGGLIMMALLADVCAGETCSRITDLGQSYATLTALLSEDSQTHLEDQEIREQVVTTSLTLLDLHKISLQQLIEFRKREEKEAGLKTLRHNYLKHIEQKLADLSANPNLTDSDKKRKQEELKDTMQDDIKGIAEALKIELKDVIFSKEVVATLAVGAAAAATAVFGAPFVLAGVLTATTLPVTIAGVLGTGNKYQKARAQIMQNHPMAYLYEMRPGLKL